MSQTINEVLQEFTANLDKCTKHTIHEFINIRAGKASPGMVESVMVDYYGAPVPLTQVANVSAPDARTIAIQPWERTIINDIERGIVNSNLGFAPSNDGNTIRITIPPLTQERRLQLVKMVKQEGEASKVVARNYRKDTNEKIKKLQKDGLSEDEAKDAESKVQKQLDQLIVTIDGMIADKEKEIMTI
ncbi:MAG: ribosome recycling factor [Bacteroidota bacterium]|nr:ribosome recycling factor [Bacteroidota bacterium]